MSRHCRLAGCGLAALAVAQAGLAQQVPQGASQPAIASDSRLTVYTAADFAVYAPRTALDIARRVPGFQIDFGDNEVRGFSGAAGNIVVNGARPSSKAESLDSTLARIPASRVTRVEVGPGDLFGAQYSGKNQVLNIVLAEGGGIDGTVTVSARRLWDGTITPDGSASALIKRGASTINLSAGLNHNRNRDEGTDTLTDPQTGALIELRRKFNNYHDFNPFVSASWALEHAPDKAIRLNARYAAGLFDLEQRNRVAPVGEAMRDDSLYQDNRNPVFEIGGDVTRPLAGGAIKLVGLATRRTRDNLDSYVQRSGLLEDGAVTVGGFEQTQKARRSETIARATWNRQNLAGLTFEVGGEIAFNRLASDVELFLLEEDGGRTRIDLPIDSAVVKERRTEMFVNAGKSLSPAVRIDAGLNYETSALTVSGDTSAERSLRFLKPKVTLDWKGNGGLHGQLTFRRSVAQLDFYDFISAAELSSDRVNAGNANLVPQRAWEARASLDHPLLGQGLIKLDLGYDLISMLQDRVLIFDEDGKGFDAPGNIGTGRRAFARLTVDAPLSSLWKGLRIRANASVQRTRVEDPITGEKRNFSGLYPDWDWEVDVRRDAGKLTYGFTVSDRDRFTFFRTNELDTNWNGGPYASAFVEYRPAPRTALTLDFDNLIDTSGYRNRLISFPNRTAAMPAINELRQRDRHINIGLTLKQSFGGASAAEGVASAG